MITYSTTFRNAMLSGDDIASIMSSALLVIYTGTKPEDPDAAATGTALVTMSGLHFDTSATNGTLFKAEGETWSGVVAADGTAGWFRLTGPGGESLDGTIGDGEDMQFSSYAWTAGQTKTLDYVALTIPVSASASATVVFESASVLTEPVSVTVGSGGDYETLIEALEYMSNFIPAFDSTTPVTGTITLLSGFTLSGYSEIKGVDLSWVEITAEDSAVGGYGGFPITKGAKGPKFSAFFTNGMFIVQDFGSSVEFSSGAGGEQLSASGKVTVSAQNAVFANIIAEDGAFVDITGATVSGSSSLAISASNNSTVLAIGADLSNSNGIQATTGSRIDATDADITGSNNTSQAANADQNSTIILDGADLSNSAGMYALANGNSTISLLGSTLGGTCGDVSNIGIFASDCSTIYSRNIGMGAVAGIYAGYGSQVVGTGTLSAAFVKAEQGAVVNCPGITINSGSVSPSYNVYANLGGKVIIAGGSISGLRPRVLRAESGGKIDARSVSVTCVSTESISAVVSAYEGGTIVAHELSFSANLSGSSSTYFLEAISTSSIFAESISTSISSGNFSYGVYAGNASLIVCKGIDVCESGIGATVSSGSTLIAPNSDLSDCVTIGVMASEGSKVNICDSYAIRSDRSGGAPYDIEVEAGAEIIACGANGLLSQTANAPTVDGIIYQEI